MHKTQLMFIALILFGCAMLLLAVRQNRKKQHFKDFNVEAAKEIKQRPFWDGFSAFLEKAVSSDPAEIENRFLAAGIYDSKWSRYYMPLKYSVLVVGEAIISALSYYLAWSQTLLIVLVSVWLVLILIGPDSYLALRAKQLTKSVASKLPYMIDLMAVCVQTGMTIEAAISYLSKEMVAFDKDLSYLLNKVNDRARIVGLDPALQEMYQRAPSNEMRSFVMTLKQSLQYGTSIYGVLTTLSSDIREVQLLHVEEKIGQLAAKMSIPLILFIMIPIVILIAAPGVMRMMNV
ncbi:type II secretion system F family protein [Methylophaga thalassica]|uniref:type II secretion system F family protein n=1 Tax=Methylophaga aminisulfidivorans TaxID=230105 RepID=UPI003A9132AC